MLKFSLFFFFLTCSCSKIRTSNIGLEPDYNFQTGCELTSSSFTTKPDVLVIGDSISIGYTSPLRDLNPSYDIIHNQCNAAYSGHAYLFLDLYLSQSNDWQIITFNAGIWDYLDERVTIDAYLNYLELTVLKLKTKTKRVVFITTTEPKTKNTRHDLFSLEAKKLMNRLNIEICDVGDYSKNFTHLIYDDVHYLEDGYFLLANYIKNCIETKGY